MDLEKRVGRSLLKRIRWGAVFGLLALIELMIIIVLLMPHLGDGCGADKDICILRSWVEPSKINTGDESTLFVEVKNVGDKDITVNVSVKSRKGVVFINSALETNDSKGYSSIAPGGTRILDFRIKAADDAHEGRYLFDIEVKEGSAAVKDTAYITIAKKK